MTKKNDKNHYNIYVFTSVLPSSLTGIMSKDILDFFFCEIYCLIRGSCNSLNYII